LIGQPNSKKTNLKFFDKTYLISTFLDPTFKLFWLERTQLTETQQLYVQNLAKQLIIEEYEKNSSSKPPSQPIQCGQGQASNVVLSPKTGKRKMFNYTSPNKENASRIDLPKAAFIKELELYFQSEYNENLDCDKFWRSSKHTFPNLYDMALKYLAVPCSSSPVERLFSVSGYILRPHRSRITETNLTNTTMLKANIEMLN
jgi:hypothetical protein